MITDSVGLRIKFQLRITTSLGPQPLLFHLFNLFSFMLIRINICTKCVALYFGLFLYSTLHNNGYPKLPTKLDG